MAKANLTTTEDIIASREIDFVTRFSSNWQDLRDLMGISRLVAKAPGTVLKSKYAEITLVSGAVAEGDSIPYSKAEVKEKDYGTITINKWKKGVSIEAIADHGYEAAVQLTDDQFLYELQGEVLDKFTAYIQTGTLTGTEATFQAALAMAQAKSATSGSRCVRASPKSLVGATSLMLTSISALRILPFSPNSV